MRTSIHFGLLVFQSFSFFFAPMVASAATVTVSIQNFAFNPASVTINVGDTVTWLQKDSTRHSSVSDEGLWAGPLLSLGQTFSRTFTAAGTFAYHCSPHPSMRGTITVQAAQNQPPTVSLTSPAEGAQFTDPASVTIEAQASDPDGSVSKVEFLAGGTLLGTATASPFRITVNLPVGTHTLTAKATDNKGVATTSAPVTISVNPPPNQPPVVSITAPASDTLFTAGSNIELQATASDPDGSITQVDFYRQLMRPGPVREEDFQLLGTDTSAPYAATVNNVTPGFWHMVARATDNKGAVTPSAEVRLIVYTPVRFLSVTRSPAGDTAIKFLGDMAVIESSSDLTAWTEVAATPIQLPDGSWLLNDTSAAGRGRLFYRARHVFSEVLPD